MPSVTRFTALSGAQDNDPLCYLMEIDDVVIMIDCGWGENFKMDFMPSLMMEIARIDAVLISHADMEHMGALPYVVGELGLSCPIYVSLPVYEMGQMMFYDLFQSHQASEEFSLFTLDDVDTTFKMMVQVKYAQVLSMAGAAEGMTIVALNSGRTLGGTIWKIMKDQEEIVYAVGHNHTTERHLSASALPSILRPSLLVTDVPNMEMWVQPPRKKREKDLIDTITSTLRGHGRVLMPVDTAGRVLELLLLLDEAWTQHNLTVYPLVWLNYMAFNVLDFAKSTLEWMNNEMLRSFQTSRGNPFDFKNVQVLNRLDDLIGLGDGPMVVMCSMPGMSSGFSRTLFTRWAGDERNTILLTGRTSEGLLAHNLLSDSQSAIDLEFNKRVPLEGDELAAFMKKRKEKREKEEKERLEAEARKAREDDSSEESDVEETIDPRETHRHDIPMEIDQSKLVTQKNAALYPMFPCIESRVKCDEYGVVVRPEAFVAQGDTDTAMTVAMDVDQETQERWRQAEIEDLSLANKCVVEQLHIELKAKIRFIDCSGRSDGASTLMILSQLAARQLVVVHVSKQALDTFQKQVEGRPKEFPKVQYPSVRQTIDVTSDVNIVQIKLKESLVANVDLKKMVQNESEYLIGWLDGEVHFQLADNELPVLGPLRSGAIKTHKPVYVGELSLSSLRKVLEAAGFKAKFVQGVLVCSGNIALKKGAEGKVVLEGPLGDDYFKIRSLLYTQYTIV